MSMTTPTAISAAIQGFCVTFPKGVQPPVYVPVDAAVHGEIDECFPTVLRHIRQHGGKMVIGWIVWEWPNVMLEATLHAIWESQEGQWRDVTPKVDGETRILFLQDLGRTDDGKRVDSIRHSDPDGGER